MKGCEAGAATPERRFAAHHRYPGILAALFALVFGALAIAPWHRADWATSPRNGRRA